MKMYPQGGMRGGMEGGALHAQPPMTFCPGLFVFLPDSGPGLRQLQLNQISTNRRNAVFFCQILLVFVLYMLYNNGIVY